MGMSSGVQMWKKKGNSSLKKRMEVSRFVIKVTGCQLSIPGLVNSFFKAQG